jgi:hypothetical protein
MELHAHDRLRPRLLLGTLLLAMLDLRSMLRMPLELLLYQLCDYPVHMRLGHRNAYRFLFRLLSAGPRFGMTHSTY